MTTELLELLLFLLLPFLAGSEIGMVLSPQTFVSVPTNSTVSFHRLTAPVREHRSFAKFIERNSLLHSNSASGNYQRKQCCRECGKISHYDILAHETKQNKNAWILNPYVPCIVLNTSCHMPHATWYASHGQHYLFAFERIFSRRNAYMRELRFIIPIHSTFSIKYSFFSSNWISFPLSFNDLTLIISPTWRNGRWYTYLLPIDIVKFVICLLPPENDTIPTCQ